MVDVWITAALTIAMLALINGYMTRRQRFKKMCAAQTIGRRLQDVLALIQLMQKHRGLGAQQGGASGLQREQIAHELNRHWSSWSERFPDALNLNAFWTKLRTNPADFDGHCHVIDQLLSTIALLERRMSTLQNQPPGIIDKRCCDLEDLARLRGLSARATNFEHCPVELEVPLRYLCQRLTGSDFQRNAAAVQAAVREICANLLDAPYIAITPARCFDLLTPIVDAALDDVRQLILEQLPLSSRRYDGASGIAAGRHQPTLINNTVTQLGAH